MIYAMLSRVAKKWKIGLARDPTALHSRWNEAHGGLLDLPVMTMGNEDRLREITKGIRHHHFTDGWYHNTKAVRDRVRFIQGDIDDVKDMSDEITVIQVARALNISRRTVYRICERTEGLDYNNLTAADVDTINANYYGGKNATKAVRSVQRSNDR